jgi:hypothetical protein
MKRVIQIKGGLGNQMFQYALYKSLKSFGFDCYLDVSFYNKCQSHNGYELPDIFDLEEIQYVDYYNEKKLNVALKNTWLNRICAKAGTNYFCDRDQFELNKSIFEICGDLYCDGYWQSEKYFYNIREQIRSDLKFKRVTQRNFEYCGHLCSIDSVSLHVRRGDYLNKPLHQAGCTIEYYKGAIDFFKKNLPNPIFIVFSDDIPWCMENFKKEKQSTSFEFVEWNKMKCNYQDMFLMSRCNGHIIANSSFSWWGAWLNKNPSKIVIAPKFWFNSNKHCEDIVPENWIKL